MPYKDRQKKRASQKRYYEKKKRLGYRLTWVSQKTPHYDPYYGAIHLPMKIKRHRKAGYKAKAPYGR